MRVSVVICTYNRAAGLRDTLNCLHFQRFPDFEVIVVNGPSTDETADVIAEFGTSIRSASCPEPNLSMSRNIGIRAAAGEVVAFIDDDALPEFDWLREIVPAFADPEVAGVGGVVFDHTGFTLQYQYSAANRFAETTFSRTEPFDDLCTPGAFTFPYLQGTNAVFRRSALLEVGGFDETFDYYLDETDLCCRLVDAGFVLRQLPNAPVHHKFLPSAIRDHQRIVTNWYPIIKNHTYFCYRHALGSFSEAEVIRRSMLFIDYRVEDALFHENAGRLPVGTSERARSVCGEAFGRGVQLGRHSPDVRLAPLVADDDPFQVFPVLDSSGRRRIVIVSSDYTPHITGGIARIMSEVAPALVALGHEVRVLTRGEHHSTVDLENGVWVHRLSTELGGAAGIAANTLDHINRFVTACAAELDRIGQFAPIDVVYGPVWDVEVLGALRSTPLPVVAMVATPAAVTTRQHGDASSPLEPELEALLRLEGEVFASASLVHALSDSIVSTVEHHYGPVFDPRQVEVIALGLPDHRPATFAGQRNSDELRVLFVGRLEPRKGITDFLDAVEVIGPLRPNLRIIVAGVDTPTSDGADLIGRRWTTAHAHEDWAARVEMLGMISDDELHAQYVLADIVVLPSRYESFGLVVVEAMMHGKAIISCDVGGIPEVVRRGTDAILVPPADPASLAEAVVGLADDADRRRDLGEAARRSYEQRLTIERYAAELDSFTARLDRVDVGSCAYRVEGRFTLTTTAGGHRGALLERGSCVTVTVPTGLAFVPVRPREPALVLIEQGGRAATASLSSTDWTRLPVGECGGPTRITVIQGRAELGAAICIAPHS